MNSRSEEEVSLIVAKSLQLVLAKKVTIEAICEKYPDLEDILRPELETAIWLNRKSTMVKPRPGFVADSRRRLLSRIEQEAAVGRVPARRVTASKPVPSSNFSWLWRFSAVAVVFVMLFLSLTGTVYAARDTVPGETLYPVKRWSEDTYYALTFDAQQQVQLSLAFSSRRLEEAQILVSRGQLDLIAQAMANYELQVNRAISILDKEQQSNRKTSEQMLRSMQEQLAGQNAKLSEILVKVPAEKSASVTRAMEATQRGADKVDSVTNKNQPQKPGTTPQGSPTVTGDNTGQGSDQGQDNPGQGNDKSQDNPGQGTDKGQDNPGQGTDKSQDNPGQGTDKGQDNPGQDNGKGTDKNKDEGNSSIEASPTAASVLPGDSATPEPTPEEKVKPTQDSSSGNNGNDKGESPPENNKDKDKDKPNKP